MSKLKKYVMLRLVDGNYHVTSNGTIAEIAEQTGFKPQTLRSYVSRTPKKMLFMSEDEYREMCWDATRDQRECTFIPEKLMQRKDGATLRLPAKDCHVMYCSHCRNNMPFIRFFFEEKPPYRPKFRFCPYCGRKVAR